MNLTLDQFLKGFERSVVELPNVLDEWERIDDDLRLEYTEQLEWMLEAQREVLALGAEAGRLVEVATRVATASCALRALSGRVREMMGIDIADSLDSWSVARATVSDPSSHQALAA